MSAISDSRSSTNSRGQPQGQPQGASHVMYNWVLWVVHKIFSLQP